LFVAITTAAAAVVATCNSRCHPDTQQFGEWQVEGVSSNVCKFVASTSAVRQLLMLQQQQTITQTLLQLLVADVACCAC